MQPMLKYIDIASTHTWQTPYYTHIIRDLLHVNNASELLTIDADHRLILVRTILSRTKRMHLLSVARTLLPSTLEVETTTVANNIPWSSHTL